MERRGSRVSEVVDLLIDQIVSGEHLEGMPLPGEDRLAQRCGVSRLTVREAVKVLTAQGLLRPVQGRGTYVEPRSSWTSVEALIRSHPGGAAFAVDQLVEVRTLIEVGGAELYATRCTPEGLHALASDLERMRRAHGAGDVRDFVAADVQFHDRIIDGCGNPFLRAAFRPVAQSLHEAQLRTSEVPIIREHALQEHANVLAGLRARSPERARSAMRAHLDQTRADARRHLASTHPPTEGDGRVG